MILTMYWGSGEGGHLIYSFVPQGWGPVPALLWGGRVGRGTQGQGVIRDSAQCSIKGNPCPLPRLTVCLSLAQAQILDHPQWHSTHHAPSQASLDF